MRFCCYLLHFSKVGGLKKDTFLGIILGPFGRQNHGNQGSRTASKNVVKIGTHFTRFWGPFWGPFGSGHAVLSPLSYKCVLHVGAREAGYIKMGPKIDDVGS